MRTLPARPIGKRTAASPLVNDLRTGVEQLIPAAIADDLSARDGQDIPLELIPFPPCPFQVQPEWLTFPTALPPTATSSPSSMC